MRAGGGGAGVDKRPGPGRARCLVVGSRPPGSLLRLASGMGSPVVSSGRISPKSIEREGWGENGRGGTT